MSPTGPEPGPPDVGAGAPDTAAAAPRRRRRRLWLAGAIALIALVALIALAALIVLAHAPFVRDSIRRAAVDAARDRFDTVLAIGRVDYNVLTLSVTASDVSAASTRTSGSPFFRADSLTVRLPLASLLGRLDFSSIDVVRPRLTITKGADGRYNFPDSGTRGGPTPNIRIGRLSIVGLDLQIQGTPPMAIEARDVSIDLRPQDGHIQGKLVAANGTTFRTPGGDVLSVAVDGVLGLDPDAIRIGPLTLSMPDSRVDIDGRLQFMPGPARLDLAVRASIGFATAVRMWSALGSGRGQVIATGRISGPLSQLVLTFDASSDEPVVRGIVVNKATAQGRIEGGAVTLSSAAIELAGGRVTGAATFGLGAESTSSATLRWDRVALAGVLQALAIPSAVPMGARLHGDASMTWNHRGLPSLALAATTRALPDATPAVTAVGGRSSLAISGSRWTLDLQHELGAGTTVAGRLFGRVNTTALSATTVGGRLAVKVNTDDLSEAIGRAVGTSTIVRSAAARVHGDVQARLNVSGTLADPVFRGSLGGDLLRVDGAGDGRLQGVVRVDRRAAIFDSLSASIGGTTIHASGSVPFDRRPMDVTTSGTMDDIAVVMGGVPARWRPSGSVAVAARISGPIAAPRVDGKVTSTRVEWDFWRPGPIDADVHMTDGRIQFVARVPSVNGTIQGSAVLSTPYAFDINGSLEQAELQRLGAIASGLGVPALEWTGTTRLSARITGAINDKRPLDVDLQVASVEGTVDGHPVRLAEPARLALSSDHVSVDALRLQVGNTRLVASGTLAQVTIGQALRLEIDGEIGEWWPQGKGRVQGVFSASGPPRHPTLSGEATVASATVTFPGYAPVTDIVARARLANDTLELVEARAAWSGAGMTAGGRIPLALLAPWLPEALVPQRPATGGLHVRADVTSLAEHALEPWVGADAVSKVTGQVAAAIELEAPRLAFDALHGTAVITQSETMIEGLTIRQPKPARVRFDGGRVLVEEASWAVGNRTLTLRGGADLRGSHPRLDLALTGAFDLALARVFLPVALSGTATIDARMSGEAQHPAFSGGVTLANAAIGVSDPRIAISGVSGRLTLDDDRIVVSAQGGINGGSLDISGSLPLLGPRASEHAKEGLRLRGQGFLLEWPEGLRSTVDADLAYRADAQGGVIAGRVSVEPGVYRRTALPLPAGDQSGAADSKSSRFGATRLDVSIATASPGLLDNSFARLEVEADVHVGGTIATPAIGGNLRAREDGKVYLRGNVFTIHRGVLELDPVARTKPTVDLTAETRRAGYHISLRLSGRTDDLIVNLSSDPPLAQPDLMSLITTGSASNSMSPGSNSGSKDNLVAAISSDILGLAGRSLGLDSVRVGELDLDLLGDDVDPQARLTIGKAIGNWLDLLLSQNLRASGFTWVVIVHPFGSYEIRFASRDSQTNSLELRHEVVFGGSGGRSRTKKPVPKPRTLPRVTGVSVTGGDMAEKDVLAVTRMQTGNRFEFFEWQRDRERVESLFHARGYLEVQVSATRDAGPGGNESVALRYQIRRGPQTRLRVTGFGLPEPVIASMKTAWSRSVDDRFLQEELRERARAAMIDLGYLWGRIDSELHVTDQPPEKTVDVTIVPGARAKARLVTFSGNQAVSERELRQEIERAGSAEKLWREPDAVAGVLKAFYRRKGFLAARVSAAPAVLDGASARLPITIHEGPRHVVSRIDVRGAGALEPGRVERWMALRVGEPFNPEEAPLVAKRIEAGYVEAGYRSARAEVTGAVEGETGRVTIVAQVHPGIRSVIREVTVIGRSQTRASVVASALKLPAGTAASPGSVDRAQHRLYETEAFRSVDIQLQPITPAIEGAGEQPTRAVVTLEEAPLYRLRYGVQLTDDLSPEIQSRDIRPGVAAELRRRNVFGSAFSGAVGGRYEWNKYSIRGALNIPTSVLWPAFSTLYVKHSVETRHEPTWFQRGETAVTYQDRWRFGRQTELSYGYAFIREDAPYSAAAPRAAMATGRTTRANLYAAVAWNSRDSVFNATRGWFHSSSVEYGSTTLGSDFNYLRYLLQQTHYRKMGPVVLAGAAQIGVLVNVTGDELQSYSLRFRTGGDRTIRGYAEESISPPGVKAGGRALLVLNGEVRFPVWRWLKAVVFLDAGNAFIDPAHILLRDLKVGTGFGLRLDTPYALFRLDVGFPIPQHSDRLIGRWYFSIGQTF